MNEYHPTGIATIEVGSQGNPTKVAYWVDSYVAGNNGILQLVTHHSVSIIVTIKYLGIKYEKILLEL